MSSKSGRMTCSALSRPRKVNPLRVSSCGTPLSVGSSCRGTMSISLKVLPASTRSLSTWSDMRAVATAARQRRINNNLFMAPN